MRLSMMVSLTALLLFSAPRCGSAQTPHPTFLRITFFAPTPTSTPEPTVIPTSTPMPTETPQPIDTPTPAATPPAAVLEPTTFALISLGLALTMIAGRRAGRRRSS